MNTANNKNRITDEGWRNTFRNALGISNNSVIELHPQAQEETMLTSRSILKASTNDVSIIERNKIGIGQVGGDKKKLGINTLTYNTNEKRTSEFHTQNSTTILESKACTSSDLSKPAKKQSKGKHLHVNVPHSNDSDDDSPTPQSSHYLPLAESILGEMMININEEEAYIHYLKQLLVLEKTEILDDFKILQFTNTLAPKHGQVKTTKHNSRITGNHDEVKNSKNKMPQMVELNATFLGRHLDRLDLRKSLLENIHDHCKDDETYKTFFNKLFDFEESLIMENVRTDLE